MAVENGPGAAVDGLIDIDCFQFLFQFPKGLSPTGEKPLGAVLDLGVSIPSGDTALVIGCENVDAEGNETAGDSSLEFWGGSGGKGRSRYEWEVPTPCECILASI
jgi:hypothetical protein